MNKRETYKFLLDHCRTQFDSAESSEDKKNWSSCIALMESEKKFHMNLFGDQTLKVTP